MRSPSRHPVDEPGQLYSAHDAGRDAPQSDARRCAQERRAPVRTTSPPLASTLTRLAPVSALRRNAAISSEATRAATSSVAFDLIFLSALMAPPLRVGSARGNGDPGQLFAGSGSTRSELKGRPASRFSISISWTRTERAPSAT